MYKIRTLNNIAETGLDKLHEDLFEISEKMEMPDGIVLRSFDMHQMEIPETVLGIARAGAGTNNVPVDECSERGIVVFNTPGGNANAVKELVITGLLIASRDVVCGSQWVQTLFEEANLERAVEAGKKKFVGPEIMGKRLGVIGLGAIGVQVANAAIALGMDVSGYDPYLSIDAAWNLSSAVTKANHLEDVIKTCDYISIHVPLNDKTRHTFNRDTFAIAKKGLRLLNFARGALVDNEALLDAIKDGIVARYVSDFPDKILLNVPGVVLTPHIGASTPESEDNCAVMACKALREFLRFGNIKNSVNFPNCIIPYTGKTRVSILHKNVPNMIGSITTVFAKDNINIDNMINKSKGQWAYTLIDSDNLNREMTDSLIRHLQRIQGVVNARLVIFEA